MATKTEKEIRLSVLEIAAQIANTSWLEQSEKVKYEAQKSNSPTYTLPADERLRNSVRNAKKLYRFIEAPLVDASAPGASGITIAPEASGTP
jgi:hypothetical protein